MDYVFSGGVDSSHADDEDTMRSTGAGISFWVKVKVVSLLSQVKQLMLL
jgi:hypothetical protein